MNEVLGRPLTDARERLDDRLANPVTQIVGTTMKPAKKLVAAVGVPGRTGAQGEHRSHGQELVGAAARSRFGVEFTHASQELFELIVAVGRHRAPLFEEANVDGARRQSPVAREQFKKRRSRFAGESRSKMAFELLTPGRSRDVESHALHATVRATSIEGSCVMGELQDKVVVVTGASRGIGRALALRFADEGAHVVLAAKTMDPNPQLPGTLGEVQEAIRARGGKAYAHAVDVRDDSAIHDLFAKVESELGGTDILINNAGALYWAPIAATPAKRFDLVMGVNARGSFLCAHHALPQMLKRGGGHVINMAPPITAECTKNRTAYMISKFGMALVVEGLAAEHGHDGIKAHALWPVTMVESQAVIGNHLGDPTMWRKPEIIVDAAMALLTGKSSVANGSAVYDEDVLASIGVTDFSSYACVPGTTPPRARLDESSSYWRQ